MPLFISGVYLHKLLEVSSRLITYESHIFSQWMSIVDDCKANAGEDLL